MRDCLRMLISVIFLISASLALADDAHIDFDRQIAPLLAGRCLDCHSGAEPKGGLDLSTVAGLKKGGESGAAVVSGELSKSLIWERVAAGDMPPKKPLSEKERELLKAWIEAGAKWGSDPIDPFRYSTAARAGYDWWSLQPVKAIAPSKKDEHPIDALLLPKLREKQLEFSAAADRRTLIRRLSFDLTGLPPTPDEIDAFIKDESPKAYATLVDRLLVSPHYGERWARHWLDVVHFGESDGFEFDKMRPNAWRYRDWVIDAFNRDLPYDQFAKLQIAGDVLEPNDAGAVIATGFLVGGAHDSLVPAGDAMRQIMRQDELEDIVGLVGQTFLGLTVHCARCHDHKFDPIRASDYYSLAACLSGVKRGERSLPAKETPDEWIEKQKSLVSRILAIEDQARKTILAKRDEQAADKSLIPEPFAAWEFDPSADDETGKLKGSLQGKAKLENGALVLNGDGHLASVPLTKNIKAKTLEAWVRLADLKQRGGGVITIQTLDGSVFDSLVIGEQEPGHWLAGSNFFQRTMSFQGPAETEADRQFVHLAIVYHADGKIAAYRNGQPYGKEYQSAGIVTFEAETSQIVIGLRHGPPGGNKMFRGLIDRARLYDRALKPEEIAASAGVASTFIAEEELTAQLSEQQRDERAKIKAELAALNMQIESYREPKTFAVTPQQPPVTHLLVRGSTLQKGPVVSPAGIRALMPDGSDFQLAADAPEAERRRKLAEWIASDQNPLFARTIVNRVWQYHFGQGLVLTPNDLGFSGGQPSHLELLDYLAREFVRRGWSLKELHRMIVTSQAYQQSSLPQADGLKVDATNRLLWRYSPRRLDAESVRDAMLMVSGELNPARGGPSYQDFLSVPRGGTQFYKPIDPEGPEFSRRSIYRMWVRGGKNPLLDTFDCPDPSTMTPTRGSTTTPLQALSLLNQSFTLRMADAFAKRLEREAGQGRAEQIQRAFVLATGREADWHQLAASMTFADKHGLPPFCRVLLNSNGFLYVD
jgi:hypothetical protein